MASRVAAVTVALVLLAVGSASAASSGLNDFTCTPSAAHPRPVVLVHGLSARPQDNWSYIGPRLRDAGWCVYWLHYGVDSRTAGWPYRPGGTRPIQESAQELKVLVDRVLRATGAQQVDLVGHSEGTVMPRWYLERLGGVPNVMRWFALTPLWRGTQIGGFAMLRDMGADNGLSPLAISLTNAWCTACTQVLTGSDLLDDLNRDGEAIPGIEHTNVMTRYDELVWPYTSGRMRDGGTNIVLQDLCPANVSEHLAVAFDPVVHRLILNALDPEHAQPVRC